jgi:hypothetical protein
LEVASFVAAAMLLQCCSSQAGGLDAILAAHLRSNLISSGVSREFTEQVPYDLASVSHAVIIFEATFLYEQFVETNKHSVKSIFF